MEMLPEYSARKNLQMLSKIRNIATEDDIKNALITNLMPFLANKTGRVPIILPIIMDSKLEN